MSRGRFSSPPSQIRLFLLQVEAASSLATIFLGAANGSLSSGSASYSTFLSYVEPPSSARPAGRPALDPAADAEGAFRAPNSPGLRLETHGAARPVGDGIVSSGSSCSGAAGGEGTGRSSPLDDGDPLTAKKQRR